MLTARPWAHRATAFRYTKPYTGRHRSPVRASHGAVTARQYRVRVTEVRKMVALLEGDGRVPRCTTGSHHHYTAPTKPGLVTVAGRPSATLKPGTESAILKQAGRPAR